MSVQEKHERHERILKELVSLQEEQAKQEWWHFKRLKALQRELVVVRAKFVCEECGASKNLTLHHLVRRTEKEGKTFAEYVRQRYDVEKVKLLCAHCHKVADSHHPNWELHITEEGSVTDAFVARLKKKYG